MTPVVQMENFSAWYGACQALEAITLEVRPNEILGVIGPAGSGKTTFLRSLNRMSDLDRSFRWEGRVLFHGIDVYRDRVDVAVLRRKFGMVFAVPVPLPGTILQNMAIGPLFAGRRVDTSDLLERTLRAAYLWDEVKDRLHQPAFTLSGGQQQRLCLARTLTLEPEVLLLDEPCSGLDPISTARIEEALSKLKRDMAIILVTNNVMQASRIADRTAFFLQGRLVEIGPTKEIYVNPKKKLTNDYITGRFG